LLQAHAGKREGVEAFGGQFGNLLFGPLARVGQERLEVVDDGFQRGVTLGAGVPQVDALHLRDAADDGAAFEVERGKRERAVARFLAGSGAVGPNLARQDVILVISEGGLLRGAIGDEGGYRGYLGGPPGGLVIAALFLLDTLLALSEPMQVLLE